MASSAAEYVFAMADGKHGVITDEAMGLGIMTLKAFDDSLCQAADEFYVPQVEEKDGEDDKSASKVTYSAVSLALIMFRASV